MKHSERQAVTIGPWRRGANNLSAEHSAPPGSFRDAENVVVADDGKISRVEGFEKAIEAPDAHSVFAAPPRLFFVSQGVLYACEEQSDGLLSIPMPAIEGVSDQPLAYCMIQPNIFVSDGSETWRIAPTNAASPWSLPPPSQPAASIVAGTLPVGRYLVATAYRAADGSEGPTSPTTLVTLTEVGGIEVHLPAPAPGASRVLIFVTKPNGTELLHFNSVVPAASTVVITKQRLGRPPACEDLSPMPPGRFAAYFNGRLLVASGDFVRWSEPHQYGYTDEAYNYAAFDNEVTGLGVVGETTNGFFVGQQNRVYFMRGENPSEARLEEVYPAGMVPGTLTHVPGARLPLEAPPTVPVPAWLSTNGVFCVGTQDGSVIPLSETSFAAAVGTEGAAAFVQRAGVNRLVVTSRSPSDNAFAVTDSVAIEVVRNGIPPQQ